MEQAGLESIATQRALASDMEAHLSRVQQAAALPTLSVGFQGQAYLAAQISGILKGPPTRPASDETVPAGARGVSVAGTLSNPSTAAFGANASCSPGAPAESSPHLPEPLVQVTKPIESAPAAVSGGGGSSGGLGSKQPAHSQRSENGPAAEEPAPVAMVPKKNKLSARAQGKVNHRVIKLPPFKKDFNGLLSDIQSFWEEGHPATGTEPLHQLVAESAQRTALKLA